MTDQTATSETKPLFASHVTPDAYLELVQEVTDLREDVEHLQANSLALPADDDTDDEGDVPAGTDTRFEVAQLTDRVNRHRAEIEDIKRRVNQIIGFLSAPIQQTSAAADGNTITPGTVQ